MKKLFAIFILALLLGGCGSAPKIIPIATPGPGPMTRLEQYIWDEVRGWQGVPYKWGGNTAGGVDCSGFAVIVYRKLFNIQLPRTTLDQVQIGTPVPLNNLKAGDLVFFRSSDTSRHVGIYLRNRMFIHASQSRGGVVVSNVDDSDWQRIYWMSRRILPEYFSIRR